MGLAHAQASLENSAALKLACSVVPEFGGNADADVAIGESIGRQRRRSRSSAGATYLGRINVHFAALAPAFKLLAITNSQQLAHIAELLESGSITDETFKTFMAFDTEGVGYITSHDGKIQSLVETIFQAHGLSVPNSHQIGLIYSEFESHDHGRLDARECICLIDALLRAITHAADPAGSSVAP